MLNAIVIVTCVLPQLVLSQKLVGIRLNPEGNTTGKLEVQLGQSWIPVCNSHWGEDVIPWNNQAAWLACRQLGFSGGRKRVYSGGTVSEPSNTPKVYNVSCGDGLYDSLSRCSYEQEHTVCLENKVAGVECFDQESEFRVEHDDPLKGKLEMLYNGHWLPVCYDGGDDDHQWSDQEAWVTCRQIGYLGGRSIAYDGLAINGGLTVNDVRCGLGFFTNLNECSFEVEGTVSKNNQQAGVECFDVIDIRLVDMVDEVTFIPTPGLSEGRLEMSYQEGEWIPVCFVKGMDGQGISWSYQAAWRACRQLGYHGGRRMAYGGVSVKSGLTVDDVRCKGQFNHLQECVFEVENATCVRDRQAGVECFDTILDIKIVHDDMISMESEGRLEMMYKDQWLPICYKSVMGNDVEWSNQAAWVACKQLGYHGGRSTVYDDLSIDSKLTVMDFRCGDGLFNHLQECFFEVEEVDCDNNQQAGVECFETYPTLRLAKNDGLELLYETQWIAVCDNTWNPQAAWVACRDLGYYGGGVSYKTNVSVASGPSVNNVRCGDGLLNNIGECFFEVEEVVCKRQAGVECFDDFLDIRLADNATTIGRLEMFYRDQWITFCFDGGEYDETWNDRAASVACRQLGYHGGNATSHSKLPATPSLRLSVKDVRCGHDYDMYAYLQNCSFELKTTDCGNGDQAGVVCYEEPTIPATSSDRFQSTTGAANPGSIANSQGAINAAIGGGVAGLVVLLALVILVLLICYKYKNRERSDNSRQASHSVTTLVQSDHLNDALHANPAYQTEEGNANSYEDVRGQTSSEYTYIDTNHANPQRNHQQNESEYAYAETPANLNPASPPQRGDTSHYDYAETPGGISPPPQFNSAGSGTGNTYEVNRNNDNLYGYAETPVADSTDEGWKENTAYSTTASSRDTNDSNTGGDNVEEGWTDNSYYAH